MKIISFLTFLITLLTALNIQANIEFSSAVTTAMKETIESDLQNLGNLEFRVRPEPQTLKVLEMDQLDSRLLEHWLFERVNYIVEDNFFSKFNLMFKRSTFIVRENVQYPSLEDTTQSQMKSLFNLGASEDAKSFTIMTNIGTDLYLEGKKKKVLNAVRINKKTIEVTSPRVGIIQIGPGLFSDNFLINTINPKAKSNSFARIATLFHEARHSDGHGENTGFAHIACPANHNYEGYFACDESLNGAYAIEKQMLIELLKNCDSKTCSESEREVLRIKIIDISSRLVKKNSKGELIKYLDSSPEGL